MFRIVCLKTLSVEFDIWINSSSQANNLSTIVKG